MEQTFDILETWLDRVRREYFSAKQNGATRLKLKEIIEFRATEKKMNVKTLYRKLNLCLRKPKPQQKVTDNRKEIDGYAKLLYEFANNKSRDGKRVAWTKAYKVMRMHELIPEHITLKQIYESIDRQNLPTMSQSVVKSWERSTPLSLVQIDYSRSRYFENRGEDGLRMRDPDYSYTDKEDERRLWFCMLVDDASRVIYAEYVLSIGESPEMTQQFLKTAFDEKTIVVNAAGEYVIDKLYQGIPKEIYWDRGPGHGSETVAGLERHEIGYIEGSNKKDMTGRKTRMSNKGAHGKVENANGDLKRDFEMTLWLLHNVGWKTTLFDLNNMLWDWCRTRNERRHPVHKDKTRWEMFEAHLEGVRYPDPDFLLYFGGKGYERIVRNRMIDFINEKFVAPVQVKDGQRVHVMQIGLNIYCMHNDKRYLLESQKEYHSHIREELPELDTDMLRDRDLRIRLDKALRDISYGAINLKLAKETHEDDVKYFYEKERSVAEVREFASRLVQEKMARPVNIIPSAHENSTRAQA